MLDVDQWHFLKGLRDASTNAVIISTGDCGHDKCSESYSSLSCRYFPDSTILCTVGKIPRADAIYLAPVAIKTQQALFDTHFVLKKSHELKNIRLPQRSIRRISSKHRTLSVVQPFANWDFLENTPLQKRLAKENLREEDVNALVQTVSRCPKNELVIEAILRLGHRMEALSDWCNLVQDKSRRSRW